MTGTPLNVLLHPADVEIGHCVSDRFAAVTVNYADASRVQRLDRLDYVR
jgi:hypothetical protein